MCRAEKCLAASLVFVATPLAWAHAVLLEGSPKAGSVFSGTRQVPVVLRFNSRIDGKRSRLTVVEANGKETTLVILPQTSPDTVSAQMQQAFPGKCRLRWQVLASDGHITRGELVFEVQ